MAGKAPARRITSWKESFATGRYFTLGRIKRSREKGRYLAFLSGKGDPDMNPTATQVYIPIDRCGKHATKCFSG
jgi:hypothetical protein